MARPVDDRGDPGEQDHHEEDDVRDERRRREEVQAALRRRILLADVARRAIDEERRTPRPRDQEGGDRRDDSLDEVVRDAPAPTTRIARSLGDGSTREVRDEPDGSPCEQAEPLQNGEAANAHTAGERIVMVTAIVITSTASQ